MTKLDTIIEAIDAVRPKISLPLPTPEVTREAIGSNLKRDGSWRKTAPKSDDGYTLHKLINFHRSSGNLHGYVAAKFTHNSDTDFEKLDNLAMLMLELFGNGCTAAENWRKALHGN